ncbi:MAG: hypothetical protein JSW27_02715 [Phycisphaerales bacterium]|nr:MAG: hypothetical protein JSW27_02715 [Phycisphaerales bacterium]
MSTIDDKLELVIGKLLDGEISPAEQRWLDEELQRNERAREVLEQLRTLSECSRQAVAAEVLELGQDPEEILRRTWQRHQRSCWRRVFRADGHLRFAAGLAAGFLLGLLLHFVLISGEAAPVGRRAVGTTAREVVATRDMAPTRGSNPGTGQEARTHYPGSVLRDVDWYSFTDRNGQQWLVEGVREGSVRPAAYYGDL